MESHGLSDVSNDCAIFKKKLTTSGWFGFAKQKDPFLSVQKFFITRKEPRREEKRLAKKSYQITFISIRTDALHHIKK